MLMQVHASSITGEPLIIKTLMHKLRHQLNHFPSLLRLILKFLFLKVTKDQFHKQLCLEMPRIHQFLAMEAGRLLLLLMHIADCLHLMVSAFNVI